MEDDSILHHAPDAAAADITIPNFNPASAEVIAILGSLLHHAPAAVAEKVIHTFNSASAAAASVTANPNVVAVLPIFNRASASDNVIGTLRSSLHHAPTATAEAIIMIFASPPHPIVLHAPAAAVDHNLPIFNLAEASADVIENLRSLLHASATGIVPISNSSTAAADPHPILSPAAANDYLQIFNPAITSSDVIAILHHVSAAAAEVHLPAGRNPPAPEPRHLPVAARNNPPPCDIRDSIDIQYLILRFMDDETRTVAAPYVCKLWRKICEEISYSRRTTRDEEEKNVKHILGLMLPGETLDDAKYRIQNADEVIGPSIFETFNYNFCMLAYLWKSIKNEIWTREWLESFLTKPRL